MAPPHDDDNEVRCHVLSTWAAMSNTVTDSNCWSLFKDTGNMWGTWKPAARKSVGKVIIEALKPHQFRTNVHDEVIIDKTPLENPESFCCRVIYLADQWPELQRLIDAAVDVSCRYYCRGGRGRVAEDA